VSIVLAGALACGLAAPAQTADQAWLRYSSQHDQKTVTHNIHTLGSGVLKQSAAHELPLGLESLSGPGCASDGNITCQTILGTAKELHDAYPELAIPSDLGPEEYWLHQTYFGNQFRLIVAGSDERGVLYGTFALLRLMATGQDLTHLDLRSHPAMPIRWVDEWDNPDGSIERGYAGPSIFFEGGNVREDLAPVAEYARLLASVGINGINVNNVNAAPQLIDSEHIKQMARIADAMRPWGVRLAMSVDIASPQTIGGLSTFDPLDPGVRAWWTAKVNEIYTLIPDFSGITVKADSEGQPGPASYGRTPADAANLLAAALEPHGGIVLYRAFVYNHHADWLDPKADRARAAYDIFHPLDGKFAANVVVQIKEGPIDFQAREPVSPLFAGLEQTSQAMELQITQEYTGQQRHLVYLAPMWKQVLDFDLRADGKSTPVKEILAGKSFHRPLGGVVGVSCVGRDGWLGSPLALANLYAFGRLAWDPDLSPEEIAKEWTRQTISNNPNVVSTVTKMLMQSWLAYENYTGPLGMQTLTDITGSHYGPNIEASENNGWGQWHRADKEGVGMDRTVATGTGYVGQYPTEVAKLYESLATTPDELLTFFHHVPYTYKLHSGKTVIQHIYDSHYEGAEQAASFAREWATLEGKIDQPLYEQVRDRLRYQAGHAIVWRDAIVQYFLKLSGIPDEKGRAGHYPGRLEAEDAKLTGYKIIDVKPWEDASGGKAVSCSLSDADPALAIAGNSLTGQASTSQRANQAASQQQEASGHDFSRATQDANSNRALAPAEKDSCTAEWTWSGEKGEYDIAVQYFDLQPGEAEFALLRNGTVNLSTIEALWKANDSLPSRRPHGDNSTRHLVRRVFLKPGDTIGVRGIPNGNDPAALDYIEVTPATRNQELTVDLPCAEGQQIEKDAGPEAVNETVGPDLAGWAGETNIGTPVEAMLVEVFHPEDKAPIATTRTNEEGGFRFTGLAPGRYRVKASGVVESGDEEIIRLDPAAKAQLCLVVE
jgi:alpha-glucuronidase